MTRPAPPSLRDLLLRSDFGRRDPRRVDELLRGWNSSESNSSTPKAPDRVAA